MSFLKGDKSHYKRLSRALGTVLFVLVCALAFFTVLIPLVLGAQSYTVLTGSMRPALEPGHLIAVRSTPIEEIRPGDIVTFQIESGKPDVATHRVVGVGYNSDGERLLTTQGDANNVQDEQPVQEVQLRGVLVYAIPWLGYINIWATPAVKSLVVTVVGIGAVTWGVFTLFKDSRRRRRLAQVSVAAAVIVTLGVFVPNPPAAHAAEQDALQLSADGVTWTDGSALPLIDASDRLVPGQDLALTLWVRNSSADAATFTITGAWTPSDPANVRDSAFAATLAAPAVDTQSIGAGESVRVPLTVGLAESAGNDTRTASATLTLTVTLAEQTAVAEENPLALTGADIPIALLVVASVLVAAGVVLIVIRLITKRRNRRDP